MQSIQRSIDYIGGLIIGDYNYQEQDLLKQVNSYQEQEELIKQVCSYQEHKDLKKQVVTQEYEDLKKQVVTQEHEDLKKQVDKLISLRIKLEKKATRYREKAIKYKLMYEKEKRKVGAFKKK